MSLLFNGVEPDSVSFNGNDLNLVSFNGNVIWEKETNIKSIRFTTNPQLSGILYNTRTEIVLYSTGQSNIYIIDKIHNTYTVKSYSDFGYTPETVKKSAITFNGYRVDILNSSDITSLKCYKYDSTTKTESLVDTKTFNTTGYDQFYVSGFGKTSKFIISLWINNSPDPVTTKDTFIYDTESKTLETLTIIGLPQGYESGVIEISSSYKILPDNYVYLQLTTRGVTPATIFGTLQNQSQVNNLAYATPVLNGNILNLNAEIITSITGYDMSSINNACPLESAEKMEKEE